MLSGVVMNAFGIVAIVTSVLGIVTPTMGILLSGLSGFFALFALKVRDPFAQGSIILNILNLTLLSPVTVLSIFSNKYQWFQTDGLKAVYWIILLLQLVGIVLWYLYSKDEMEGTEVKPKERVEPRI